MELSRAVLEGLRINRDEWQTRACQEELRADALEIERNRYRAALERIAQRELDNADAIIRIVELRGRDRRTGGA